MHEYITNQIIKYAHPKPPKPQHSPFKTLPPTFGKDSQKPQDHDTSPALPKDCKLCILKIAGSLLFYGRAIDNINHLISTLKTITPLKLIGLVLVTAKYH